MELTYLTSYEHHGKFAVSCALGCTCKAEFDGHINAHHSMPLIGKIPVLAAHDSCTIVVGANDLWNDIIDVVL